MDYFADEKKGLVDSFSCGCMYYHLAEIYFSEPFYDSRYSISNYKKALAYFEQCDSPEEIQKKKPYVDKCMLQLTEAYGDRGSIDEAIALCRELSDRYSCLNMQESSDETIVTASALYKLGELYQRKNALENSIYFYEQAARLSSEGRQFFENDLNLTRLYLMASIKARFLSGEKEYEELLTLGETYCRKNHTRYSMQMLAELYRVLWTVDKKYARRVYDLYEKLFCEYPALYTTTFYRMRNQAWEIGVLDEGCFPMETRTVTKTDKYGKIHLGLIFDEYELYLAFLGCEPLGVIKKLTLTQYKWSHLKDVFVFNRMVRKGEKRLQICPKGMWIPADQKERIPDDRVWITYENGETVEYGLCYG